MKHVLFLLTLLSLTVLYSCDKNDELQQESLTQQQLLSQEIANFDQSKELSPEEKAKFDELVVSYEEFESMKESEGNNATAALLAPMRLRVLYGGEFNYFSAYSFQLNNPKLHIVHKLAGCFEPNFKYFVQNPSNPNKYYLLYEVIINEPPGFGNYKVDVYKYSTPSCVCDNAAENSVRYAKDRPLVNNCCGIYTAKASHPTQLEILWCW